jgi:predicted molibdopterin-dependent oxidoreductase YjgC
MVKVTIDGKEVEVLEDTTILKAAEKAGVWIPTMCHCDYIEPYGVCRLCSVEVIRGKRSRLVTSCNYPVREGLTVRTDSDKVKWIRKMIMELMLSRWPNVPAVKDMKQKMHVSCAECVLMFATTWSEKEFSGSQIQVSSEKLYFLMMKKPKSALPAEHALMYARQDTLK